MYLKVTTLKLGVSKKYSEIRWLQNWGSIFDCCFLFKIFLQNQHGNDEFSWLFMF